MMIIGTYELGIKYPDGRLELGPSVRNTLMASHGHALCRLLGFGDRNYRINMVYIEYENTPDPVAAPAYDATDSRLYYENLTAPKDYLRVPITGSPVIGIAAGYEDYFTAGSTGNTLRVAADSVGSTGMHGQAFSNAASSRVYGVALVAAPVANDPSRDVIITRGYYATDAQMIKPPTGQVHVGWTLEFTLPS